MNTHLKQLWAAMKLPKNFKKSYKFFCRGLDIRVTKLVEAENAICYDIVRGYGLRRSLFGRRGGISSWHEKAENISIQKCLDLLLPMQ